MPFEKKLNKWKRLAIYKRDDYKCCYCGKKVIPGLQPYEPRAASIDHIVPTIKGGTSSSKNLVTSCMPCNMQKGTKTIRQWFGLIRIYEPMWASDIRKRIKNSKRRQICDPRTEMAMIW